MNKYNDRWTREKFLEYRKLKRSGFSDRMLIEHFGEDIYHSDLYNKNGTTLPKIIKYSNFINEIKINPEETEYDFVPRLSTFIEGKTDYIITFNSNGIPYIVYLMFFPINGIDTYNIVFTTEGQWREYNFKLRTLSKGVVADEEFTMLDDIIGKETKFNDLFPIFRRISWILLDFYDKYLSGQLLSLIETKNRVKINLYRNIIKDSFKDIMESEETHDGETYYVYRITIRNIK